MIVAPTEKYPREIPKLELDRRRASPFKDPEGDKWLSNKHPQARQISLRTYRLRATS